MFLIKIKFSLATISLLTCTSCVFDIYEQDFQYSYRPRSVIEQFEQDRADQYRILTGAQSYYHGSY